MVYFISRIIYKIILKLFFKFEVKGRENVPEKGPFIVVANHVSYVDPAVMGVACHTVPVTFLAKEEVLKTFILGAWSRAVGCIFINRSSGGIGSLKKVLEKLNKNGAVGIFPEGTRSVDGNLGKAEPGVGIIAAKSGAPLIPMYIFGTREMLPIGSKFFKPSRVAAKVGRPVDISEKSAFPRKRDYYRFIGERAMEAILQLKHE